MYFHCCRNNFFLNVNNQWLNFTPIIQGNTDIEQLALVIKILGSPQSKDWPEIDSLPDFKKIQYVKNKQSLIRNSIYRKIFYSFSHSNGDKWENIFPTCTTYSELALVDGLVKYNPKKRLTASEVQLCKIQKILKKKKKNINLGNFNWVEKIFLNFFYLLFTPQALNMDYFILSDNEITKIGQTI